MAELHVIGDLASGEQFGGMSYFCVFEMVTGEHWSVVEGRTSGCTHIMASGEDDTVAWCFPIDVHFTTNSVEGWPKISLQVWSVDSYGRKDLAGYGVAFLPPPSMEDQEVVVATWKPCYWNPNFFSRMYERLRLLVLGGNPVLRDKALIHTNDERFKLYTVSGGTVRLQLSVVSRGMQRLGIRCSSTGADHKP
ncbi:B9 protein domain 2 [Trypanosoma grayi]|uniref:B9 protein domain 2 n=1 Tax=Trypanosoma grayi TaxID=71804 RepID=UPI0004F44B9F|nr:B9 protein domain 2 [Trypanosoma grayi]KEG12583.1 B9 protein domain 2 [Trypanosoma grayi]